MYLELLTPKGYQKVDSAKVDNQGVFELHAFAKEPEIYRINLGMTGKFPLVIGKNNIEVNADARFLGSTLNLTGNPEVQVLSKALKGKLEYENQQKALLQRLRTANQNAQNDQLGIVEKEKLHADSIYHQSLKTSINSITGSLTAALVLNEFLDPEDDLDFYENSLQAIVTNHPKHWFVEQLNTDYEKTRRLAIGAIAPDFSLPDPDGNEIALSSLKGKYVFLDFWASWCQPCRAENPDLVRIYEYYRKRDFEVLGVSMDRKKENWIKAIEKDGLTWINVSDLKYFDSDMIELYSIVNVPTTFLLDPEGRIIAKDIHANELEQMLAELL